MTNEFPLVCICVPTYNSEKTIGETLESILTQSYPNLVVHVSDNNSTDETVRIVESIADPRVTVHQHSMNIGGEGNFNRCIQLAEGEYVAIFHADDIYESKMVAEQVKFLEKNSKVGAVFTEAVLIDEFGVDRGEIRLPQDIINNDGIYDYVTMFKAVLRHGNFFVCPSFMVRRLVYQQEIKVWRSDLFGSGADLDVWFRILQNHSIGHIPKKLIKYRVGPQQFSAQVRRETERSLLFKILDYYIAHSGVHAFLSAYDLQNYKYLERRDRVMRALNLFILDRPKDAVDLLSDIYSHDTMRYAFKSKRGALTLIVGTCIKLFIMMKFYKLGKLSLTYVTKLTNK